MTDFNFTEVHVIEDTQEHARHVKGYDLRLIVSGAAGSAKLMVDKDNMGYPST